MLVDPNKQQLLVLSCHCQRNVLRLAVDRQSRAGVLASASSSVAASVTAARTRTHDDDDDDTTTTPSFKEAEGRTPSARPRQHDELDEHQQEETPSSHSLISSSSGGGGGGGDDDDDDNDGVCQVCACSWCIKRRAVWLCTGIARPDVKVLQTSGGGGEGVSATADGGGDGSGGGDGDEAGGDCEEGRLSPSSSSAARYGLKVIRGFSGDHFFPRHTAGASESLARASDSSGQKHDDDDDGDGDDDGDSKRAGCDMARGDKTAVEAAAAATTTIYRFHSSSSASIPSSSSGDVPLKGQGQGRGLGASHVSCSTCGTFMLSYGFPSRRQTDTLDRRSSIDDDDDDDATGAAQGGCRAEEVVWLNLRAVRDHDFDLWKVPLKLFDGASLPPPYIPRPLPSTTLTQLLATATSNGWSSPTLLTGGCHCQAIRFAVAVKQERGLEECRVMDCSCSICLGNGCQWIYPGRRNVLFDPPHLRHGYQTSAPTITYSFDPNTSASATRPRTLHVSCATCGCHLYEYSPRPVEDPRPVHVRERLGPWAPEDGTNGSFGLNVALLDIAGEFAGDVLGLSDGEQQQQQASKQGWRRMENLERSTEDRSELPRFTVRL